MSRIGDTMMAEFEGQSNDQIEIEYRRQVSNGTIARENERHGLTKFMQENQNAPDTWRPFLAKNKERIRKGILSGITQPQARHQVELELNEDLAGWDRWLDDSALKQTGINANADFLTGVKRYQGPAPQFNDLTDFQSYLQAANLHIEQGHNGGKNPVDALPTRAVADAASRGLTQHITGEYLLQQALATGNEALVTEANGYARNFGATEEEQLFGPEELADLKKRYDLMTKAAQSQAHAERTGRADAFEQQTTRDILTGKFTFKDEKGNEVNWRDAIIANPDLEPEKKRTLESEYRQQVNLRAKGKEYTEAEKLEAYISVRTEQDPKKKLDLLKKNAPVLGFNEVQSLYDKMNKTTDDDSHLASGLQSAITAIVNLREKNETKIPLGTIHVDTLRLQDRILREWDVHPDWTSEQKLNFMETVLAPAKAEAGKSVVSNLRTMLFKPIWQWPSLSGAKTPQETTAAGPTRVNTKVEYDALAPGTVYLHPDGRVLRKR